MPTHALSVSIRDLHQVLCGPRPEGWLMGALDPLVALFEEPSLCDCSETVEHPFLEHSVRAAAEAALDCRGSDWPILTRRCAALSFVHGTGVVGDHWLVFVWLEDAGRGLVMLVEPESGDTHVVSMRVGGFSFPPVAEA